MILNTHPMSAEVARVAAVLAAETGDHILTCRALAVRCVEAVESAVIDRAIAEMERMQ